MPHRRPLPGILLLTLATALFGLPVIAGTLGPGTAPASAQQDLPPFLYPHGDDVLTGVTTTSVFFDDPAADFVRFTLQWNQGEQSFTYATDEDGTQEGLGGWLNETTTVTGVWQGALEMPPEHPPGPATLIAEACLREVESDPCAFRDVARTDIYADGTPPQPVLDPSLFDTTLPGEGTHTVEIRTDDPNLTDIDVFIREALAPGKGLPLKDQHEDGENLSGDLDGDGESGDMSCAPTATGSSLAWFDDHGYGDIMGEGVTNKDLVEDLGERMDTDDSGTAPAVMPGAIKEFLEAVGLGDDFEVSDFSDLDLDDLQQEYDKEQDIVLALYWEGGGGHAVAVEDVEVNDDGSATITIMDPWTGTYEEVEIDAGGDMEHSNGDGIASIDMMHVSPKEPEQTPLGPAELVGTEDGRQIFELELDTGRFDPGRYVLEAEGDDGVVQLDDWTSVEIAPPGEAARPEIRFAESSGSGDESVAEPPVTVLREGDLSPRSTVRVRSFPDSATAGEDYDSLDRTVVFESGQDTATLAPVILDDDVPEDPEDLLLELSEPTDATIGLPDTFTYTIENDDGPGVAFARSHSRIDEGEATVLVDVVRTETDGRAEVDVSSTGDGTATPGEDFEAVDERVVFEDGDGIETVVVRLDDDPDVEGDETIPIEITAPDLQSSEPITVIEPSVHTVTLVDDECATSDSEAACEVPPGGTVSTGGTLSADNPFAVSITVPDGGQVSLSELPDDADGPPGFSLLPVEFDIDAPSGTVDDPLLVRFHVFGWETHYEPFRPDGSVVLTLRDGVAVRWPDEECSQPGRADPDPCVNDTSLTTGDGFFVFVMEDAVLAPSRWQLAVSGAACPPDGVPDAGFGDVDEGSTHDGSIDCTAWWDVARGRDGGSYAPTQPVRRGQMASFIVRMLRAANLALPASPPDAFSDDDGTAHERRINQLAAVGVVRGREDGTYGPHQPVRRDQMASLLIRALELRLDRPLPSGGDAFTDDDGTVHERRIDKLAEAGVTEGVGGDRYAPTVQVPRGQMASFLARTLGLFVGEGFGGAPTE